MHASIQDLGLFGVKCLAPSTGDNERYYLWKGGALNAANLLRFRWSLYASSEVADRLSRSNFLKETTFTFKDLSLSNVTSLRDCFCYYDMPANPERGTYIEINLSELGYTSGVDPAALNYTRGLIGDDCALSDDMGNMIIYTIVGVAGVFLLCCLYMTLKENCKNKECCKAGASDEPDAVSMEYGPVPGQL